MEAVPNRKLTADEVAHVAACFSELAVEERSLLVTLRRVREAKAVALKMLARQQKRRR
jgi:hypothetical protein